MAERLPEVVGRLADAGKQVRHPAVAAPLAVRYAWANWPEACAWKMRR